MNSKNLKLITALKGVNTLTDDFVTTLKGQLTKQALRKFSETAKGWYWNMKKLYRKYAVKLYPMIMVVNQFTCF